MHSLSQNSIMEPQTLTLSLNPNRDFSSNVDTSRPFRSVKEAVATFGERFLVGEIYSPKPFSFSPPPTTTHDIITSWSYSPSPQQTPSNNEQNDKILYTLKKLEADLEETKMELKLLKKREAETEVALATLNAELHKNMSKLAEAEATAAKKAIEATKRVTFESGRIDQDQEKRKETMMRKKENSTTLAQILSVNAEKDQEVGCFGGRKERKMMKKRPIVPLVTDLFFKKNESPNSTLHNTIYASPNMYFN